MSLSFQGQPYSLKRYPSTTNRSLQAWSAADEHLLRHLEESKLSLDAVAIWHDRFGALGTVLANQQPLSILTYHSQQKALQQNLQANQLTATPEQWLNPLTVLPSSISLGLLRVPKSLDLFRLYLRQAAEALQADGQLIGSFMTRHFSPKLLQIAGEYFGTVEQSRAWKKSRLLLLSSPKSGTPKIPLQEVELDDDIRLQQYPGVFSAQQVDPATRMLIEHLLVREEDQDILDLGCGNGVITRAIQAQFPDRTYHLHDDSVLATESARLNLTGDKVHVHLNDSLKPFADDSLDLVVSNPPFHLGHENNIEISLRLFKEVRRVLRPEGHFQLVGNRHLNYRSHLLKLFPRVTILGETPKFLVYRCG
ncbi:MAG: methyltransferase [Bacteroidota bacterium]